jgi:hypothetical protein
LNPICWLIESFVDTIGTEAQNKAVGIGMMLKENAYSAHRDLEFWSNLVLYHISIWPKYPSRLHWDQEGSLASQESPLEMLGRGQQP